MTTGLFRAITYANNGAGELGENAYHNAIGIKDFGIAIPDKKTNDALEKVIALYEKYQNTEGIILFAKSYICANELSKELRERTAHKFYYCVVNGIINKDRIIEGYIKKDHKNNKVTVYNNKIENSDYIKTRIIPVKSGNKVSIVEIELITGKSHQIRAHLASIGYPLIGDYKYGNRSVNDFYKKKYHIEHHLLFSYKFIFPELNNELKYLSGKEFILEIPKLYEDVLNGDMEK